MKKLILVFVLVFLTGCSRKPETVEVTEIPFPERFDQTELGVEYNKLQQLYGNYNFSIIDSIRSQAYIVLDLLEDEQPYHVQIMGVAALCLRMTNPDYLYFKDFPNKEFIFDLYDKAQKIGNDYHLQNTVGYRNILLNYADCLEEDSQFLKARKVRQEYYELTKGFYGSMDAKTADALMFIGNSYFRQMLVDSALIYYDKELVIRKKTEKTEKSAHRIIEIEGLKKHADEL